MTRVGLALRRAERLLCGARHDVRRPAVAAPTSGTSRSDGVAVATGSTTREPQHGAPCGLAYPGWLIRSSPDRSPRAIELTGEHRNPVVAGCSPRSPVRASAGDRTRRHRADIHRATSNVRRRGLAESTPGTCWTRAGRHHGGEPLECSRWLRPVWSTLRHPASSEPDPPSDTG